MNFSNKPIKFSLIMISIFIVLVIGFSQFGLERLKNDTKENIQETLQTVLRTNHETLYIWISQRKLDIANLAKKRELVNLTSKLIIQNKMHIKPLYVSTLGKIKRYLSPELEKNINMEFYVISSDRVTIASSQDGYIGKVNFIHKYRKNNLDKVFNGKTDYIKSIDTDISLDSTSESSKDSIPKYFIVAPIQDIFGVTIAVLAIRIDPSHEFSSITQLGRLGESGETYAFNENGMLITESRFEHQLRSIGLISPDKQSEILLRIADPGVNMLEGQIPTIRKEDRPLTLMAQSAIQSESGFNVEGYRDYRGVPVMGAWLWDKDLGFGLATEIDMSEGMQNYNEIRNTLIIILSITVSLSILLFTLIEVMQKESERKLKRAHSELEERVVERTRELEDAKSNLTRVNKELEVLSITDGLTGISNRRNFDIHLDNEWRHCIRESMSVTIIMLDIDYFKKYNDTYGHQKGDECLKSIAYMLNTTDLANRPGDIVARYGGEEFIVLLVDASVEYSRLIANKIHSGLANLKIPHETTEIDNYEYVSVSVGYAREENINKNGQKELIKKADEALYKAKHKGRNQVCSN